MKKITHTMYTNLKNLLNKYTFYYYYLYPSFTKIRKRITNNNNYLQLY